jgi:hypothetical protein
MLRVNSWQKLSIKIVALACFGSLVLLHASIFWFNKKIAHSKLSMIKAIEQTFGKSVDIGEITYQFPNTFLIKQIVMREPLSRIPFFTSPQLDFRFGLFKLFSSHNLTLNKLNIHNADIEFNPFYNFVAFQLMEYVKNCKGEHFELNLMDSIVKTSAESDAKIFLIQSKMALHGPTIQSSGSLKELKKEGGEKLPFNFALKGVLNPEDFDIVKLEIWKDNLYSRLSGHKVHDYVWLYGYATQDDNLAYKQLKRKLNLLSQNKLSGEGLNDLANIDVYVSGIDVFMQITKTSLNAKRVFFKWNNIPVNVTGQMALNHSNAFNINTEIDLTKVDEFKELRKIETHFKGDYSKKVIKSDADLTFTLKDKIGGGVVDIALKNVALSLLDSPRCAFTWKEGKVDYQTLQQHYSLPLERTAGYVNIKDKEPYGSMWTHVYDGLLNAKFSLDTHNVRPIVITNLRCKDLKLNQMAKNMHNPIKFNGLLDSQILIKNTPKITLKGRMNLKNGSINDQQFVERLTARLDLPYKDSIKFEQISSDIAFDGRKVDLPNFRLETKDIQLRGSLTMGENILIASQFSLFLNRNFALESKYLRPTISRVNKDINPLRFDFKVSGYATALNVQWADSEVKKEIQSRVPDFIERIVEDRIQRSIDETSLN